VSRALGAVLLGAILCASAAAFDSLSLLVPGIGLMLLGVVSAAWIGLASAGASVERTLGDPTVEEEQPYPLLVGARTGLLPAPGGELVEPLVTKRMPMAGRRARRLRVEVHFARRGRRVLEGSRLELRDPLGLATRTLRAPAAEVLVLPRIEPVLAAGGGGAGAVADSAALAATAAELELDSLRPYRQGAPAARIHWPTVARTGELVERRLVADEDARPLVVLDARRSPGEEELDRAVRAAASLVVHLARSGGCALLLPGDRRATAVEGDLRVWPGLHARLALLEPAEEPPGTGRLRRGGAIFWVVPGAAEAPVGLRRAMAGTRYLVSAVPLENTASVFTVAGCSGYRLRNERVLAA